PCRWSSRASFAASGSWPEVRRRYWDTSGQTVAFAIVDSCSVRCGRGYPGHFRGRGASPIRTTLASRTLREKFDDSLQHPPQLLPQAVQNAELGGVDGPDGETQLGGHLRGRPIVRDRLPARLPGRLLEVGPHDREGPAGQVLLVLGLPERFQVVRPGPRI